MDAWLGASRRTAPAVPDDGADMLDDLRLVLDRILLFKPGDGAAGIRGGAVTEGISMSTGRLDARKTMDAVRAEASVERYVRTELRP